MDNLSKLTNEIIIYLYYYIVYQYNQTLHKFLIRHKVSFKVLANCVASAFVLDLKGEQRKRISFSRGL